MRKLLLLPACILAICCSSEAQVDPLYAQYLSNPMLINPAYAGLNNNLNASVTYRAPVNAFSGRAVRMKISQFDANNFQAREPFHRYPVTFRA